MQRIENAVFDEERALYGERDLFLSGCRFDGEADGESALKEASGIHGEHCFFNLRYPLWHVDGVWLKNCEMTSFCRAAMWYTRNADIRSCQLHGIKALRECADVYIENCDIVSPEFGWSVRGLIMRNCTAESEYFLMRGKDIRFENVRMKGKYSFQYIENAVFENCVFDTKDAFWHGKNITVRNSLVKGEYLAWYSDGLTLENCRIIGTQPFCYCRGLRLIGCEMTDTDLCFEKSDVEARILTPVVSIKNPRSGCISVPSVGELILDDPQAKGVVRIMEKA